MDQVEFQPAAHWTATVLNADMHHSENSITREIFKMPVLIRAGGGTHNSLYHLRLSTCGSEHEGSNTLGKLQITWSTNLGEAGRLQTQQILGTPIVRKDIELHPTKIPSHIILHRPFLVVTDSSFLQIDGFEQDKKVAHRNHDQCFYLTLEHQRKLKEKYGVEPCTFEQKLGEAVFIPAGCPHQVRNLKSCTKVVVDFVSPENLNECFWLTEEFRKLPKNQKSQRRQTGDQEDDYPCSQSRN